MQLMRPFTLMRLMVGGPSILAQVLSGLFMCQYVSPSAAGHTAELHLRARLLPSGRKADLHCLPLMAQLHLHQRLNGLPPISPIAQRPFYPLRNFLFHRCHICLYTSGAVAYAPTCSSEVYKKPEG